MPVLIKTIQKIYNFKDDLYKFKEIIKPPIYDLYKGQKVFIRTATLYYVGRVHKVRGRELYLTEASWVAYTGRFSEVMTSGNFEEVESYPKDLIVIVNTDFIVDKIEVYFDLPKDE